VSGPGIARPTTTTYSTQPQPTDGLRYVVVDGAPVRDRFFEAVCRLRVRAWLTIVRSAERRLRRAYDRLVAEEAQR
jgi:hypothetical protein